MPIPVEIPNNQQDNFYYSADALTTNNTFNDESLSKSQSQSESENTVVQDVSQSNYNINSNHVNYNQFANGSRVAVPSWQTDFVYNPSTGDKVIKTGLVIPLGGKSTKIALRHASLDATARLASTCSALVKNYEIDYEMLPELADCEAFKQKTIVASAPLDELKLLRQQIEDQKKAIEKMQRTILIQQVQIEMKASQPPLLPPEIPASW